MNRARVTVIAIAAVLVVAVAGAWAFERFESVRQPYSVAVTKGGKVLGRFTLGDIKAMPQASFAWEGRIEEGPSVRTVLGAAGVTEFRRVTFVGPGGEGPEEKMLASSEVTENVLLDIANRGTVKLAGPDIPRDERVRDVTELRVE